MNLFQALVLGLVQGLTEFLPVSSSAHLVLVPALLGWRQPELAFLALLHAGTLLGLIAYFWRDLLWLAGGLTKNGPQRRLLTLMAVATLPGVALGALFEKQFEEQFGNSVSVAFQLVVTGVILIAADQMISRRKKLAGPQEPDSSDAPSADRNLAETVSPLVALGIGIAQAVSIVPGISRSGATMAAGIAAGLTRVQAARFSFLIAIAILTGATFFELPQLAGGITRGPALLAGFVASGLSGYAAIAGLIGYLQRRSLGIFAAYCLAAGAVSVILLTR